MTAPRGALEQIWAAAGGDPAALERVSLTGDDPMLPTDVRIGTAAAAVIAATGLAASELWRLRTGRAQSVAVDVRAAIAAFRSERYLRVNGGPAPDGRSPLFGFYPTADGRLIQIHANMPHHHAGHVRFMGCEETRESMAAAVAKWKAQDLEDALNAAGLPAGMVRPQRRVARASARARGGRAAAARDRAHRRLGARAFGGGDRPLAGVRVLDLTPRDRGAGGRAHARLARGGRAATWQPAPAEPAVARHRLRARQAGRHARSAPGRGRRPAAGADRRAPTCSPSPTAPARSRGSASPPRTSRGSARASSTSRSRAYSHAGPWRERRGFETLIQSVSGLAHEQGFGGGLGRPQPSPRAGRGSRHRVPGRARRARRPRAPRPRGRELSRARLARADRALGGLARAHGRPPRGRPDPGRRRRSARELREPVRAAHPRDAHRAPVRDRPVLGIPAGPGGTHEAGWPT